MINTNAPLTTIPTQSEYLAARRKQKDRPDPVKLETRRRIEAIHERRAALALTDYL